MWSLRYGGGGGGENHFLLPLFPIDAVCIHINSDTEYYLIIIDEWSGQARISNSTTHKKKSCKSSRGQSRATDGEQHAEGPEWVWDGFSLYGSSTRESKFWSISILYHHWPKRTKWGVELFALVCLFVFPLRVGGCCCCCYRWMIPIEMNLFNTRLSPLDSSKKTAKFFSWCTARARLSERRPTHIYRAHAFSHATLASLSLQIKRQKKKEAEQSGLQAKTNSEQVRRKRF